jgi:hypothetical protein
VSSSTSSQINVVLGPLTQCLVSMLDQPPSTAAATKCGSKRPAVSASPTPWNGFPLASECLAPLPPTPPQLQPKI